MPLLSHCCVPPAQFPAKVNVLQSCPLKRLRQSLTVELGSVTRIRVGADIRNNLDPVLAQKFQKALHRMVRVSDGQDTETVMSVLTRRHVFVIRYPPPLHYLHRAACADADRRRQAKAPAPLTTEAAPSFPLAGRGGPWNRSLTVAARYELLGLQGREPLRHHRRTQRQHGLAEGGVHHLGEGGVHRVQAGQQAYPAARCAPPGAHAEIAGRQQEECDP